MQPIPRKRELQQVTPTALAAAQAADDEPVITLGDVYYVLFRHKWKIILCALAGIAGALAFYKIVPRIYESEAKLFIQYVVNNRPPMQGPDDNSVKSPDPAGFTILNSELEIITSMDLAGKIVDTVGIEKFVQPLGDGRDRSRAIFAFTKNLSATVPARSSVIQITYKSTDPTVVQPILREVINTYLKRHVEIHRASGIVDDFLNQETELLRSRLAQTEEELRKATKKTGYNSLEEAQKRVSEQMAKLRDEINLANTELAERTAFIQSLESTNISDPNALKDPAKPSLPNAEIIASYNQVKARVESLKKVEQELLVQFTPESTRVQELRAQLAEAEQNKKRIETENPSILLLAIDQPAQSNNPSPSQRTFSSDLVIETARLKATQSKIAALNGQLEKLKADASTIEQLEATIVELERKKVLEIANYNKYAASLEKARLDHAMNEGQVSNISEIQAPSLPIKTNTKRVQMMAALCIGGLALGLGWAFIIDRFFDLTIKRPAEVERRLKVPLLLTMPRTKNQSKPNQSIGDMKALPNSGGNGGTAAPIKPESSQMESELQPYFATLRDRLIASFENRNLTHNPKLIAVTGLHKGAGVSRTAAGIAQSLSETGEGNVLLVNMNSGRDSAQQYVQGKPVPQLDEILDSKTRKPSDENLYVVTEGSNSDRLLRNLPQRFTKLLPKLRASDFDYIIFDMPNVSQVSITPRLAGYMDQVLMVVEAEKTDRELISKATALLAKSNAEVGVVLNKTRNYIPTQLYQESLGDL